MVHLRPKLSAKTALAIAREKADARGIEVEFVAADAFQLGQLERSFKTVLDCLLRSFQGQRARSRTPDLPRIVFARRRRCGTARIRELFGELFER
jgi:hypothetical protein